MDHSQVQVEAKNSPDPGPTEATHSRNARLDQKACI